MRNQMEGEQWCWLTLNKPKGVQRFPSSWQLWSGLGAFLGSHKILSSILEKLMTCGIQGLINASDLKHCNLLVSERGKGSWKSVLVPKRQWAKAKMFLWWREAAGEAGTGAWGWQPRGHAQLALQGQTAAGFPRGVLQRLSSVAAPQGCPALLWLQLWAHWEHLCIVRVVENFKNKHLPATHHFLWLS